MNILNHGFHNAPVLLYMTAYGRRCKSSRPSPQMRSILPSPGSKLIMQPLKNDMNTAPSKKQIYEK